MKIMKKIKGNQRTDGWAAIIARENDVEIETLAEIDSMFEVWTAIIECGPHLRHKLDKYEDLMLRICKRDWGEEAKVDFDRSALTICAKAHGAERRWSLPNKSILANKNALPLRENPKPNAEYGLSFDAPEAGDEIDCFGSPHNDGDSLNSVIQDLELEGKL